jgi:hypothetical protein
MGVHIRVRKNQSARREDVKKQNEKGGKKNFVFIFFMQL